MHRWHAVAFACHRCEQVLEVFESDAATRQAVEGVAAGRQQVECGAVGHRVHAERTENAQFLHHDQVGNESWCAGVESAGARNDDGAAGPGKADRLRERGRRHRGDVNHDVGQAAGG